MPHIIAKIAAGRSEDKKQLLARELTQAVMDALDADENSVSVSIEDVPMSEWAERVYVPDIQDKPDLIYKPPGYDPFK
jgi:4-oxalocrotonate tautomerase